MCRCIVTHINVRQGLALWSLCCAEQVTETANRYNHYLPTNLNHKKKKYFINISKVIACKS